MHIAYADICLSSNHAIAKLNIDIVPFHYVLTIFMHVIMQQMLYLIHALVDKILTIVTSL